MAVLNITDQAAQRIKTLAGDGVLRLGTATKGCNGLSYQLDRADTPLAGDELVEDKGVRLYIDAGSLLYLIGSTMDWREDELNAGFVFENPNEKARCGCGESFSV